MKLFHRDNSIYLEVPVYKVFRPNPMIDDEAIEYIMEHCAYQRLALHRVSCPGTNARMARFGVRLFAERREPLHKQ